MSTPPYRILHVFGEMNCGGAETRIMDLYRYIDKSKIQFDFLVLLEGNHFYDTEIKKHGGRIYRVRHPRTSIIGHCIDMYKIMKNNGPFQAIHSHTSYHSGISLLVARIAGIKYRLCHARTTSTKKSKSLLKRIMIYVGRKLILDNATSLVAISKQSARFLFGKKIIKTGGVKIIPNSIDLDLYRDISLDNIFDKKAEFKIPQDTLIIGQVGRFSFMKNHKFTIEIAKFMKAKEVKFQIIFVGDGELKKDVESMVDDYNLRENIKFAGLRKDIPQLMKMFDVLIMPSYFEGLGGVVIEAQAAGTPCIVSDKLPEEVDMGLELVKFLPLSDSIELWTESIIKSSNKHVHDFETINSAFIKKNFTLSYEEKELIAMYGVNESY